MTNREYLIKKLPSGAIIKGLTSDWFEAEHEEVSGEKYAEQLKRTQQAQIRNGNQQKELARLNDIVAELNKQNAGLQAEADYYRGFGDKVYTAEQAQKDLQRFQDPSQHSDCSNNCELCETKGVCGTTLGTVDLAKLQQWAKEHPEKLKKTRQDVFLEQCPNVAKDDGVIDILPCRIDTKLVRRSCFECRYNGCNCRIEYWNEEVEECVAPQTEEEGVDYADK